MKKELLKGLTEEQINKVKICKNKDELLKLAKEEGIQLTDEQLEAVNGGGCTSEPPSDVKCPKCGSNKTEWVWFPFVGYELTCKKCGHEWNKK